MKGKNSERGKDRKCPIIVLLVCCVILASAFVAGNFTKGNDSVRKLFDNLSQNIAPEQYTSSSSQSPDSATRACFGVSFVIMSQGAQITEIVVGSPAETAGLCEGDLIIR